MPPVTVLVPAGLNDFFVCAAMDITAVATAISFYPVNPISAYLLVPYLGWGLFATALNYRIMVDNPNASQLGKDETDKPILDTTIPGAD